ncbi:hypothetical protein ABZ897_53060 [Nonomuraea sp. NPDC046802]|uniref:hypothetical protein n=1 Tax=Nonomuraea sp. NPDC046802 TaxID=3154919 RepID=UPI0033FE1D9E
MRHVTEEKKVDPGLPYLAGHFPEVTIYPGVFIIDDVERAVAAVTGAPVHLTHLRSARFLRPLLSGDGFRFHLQITPAASGFEVDARCEGPDGVTAATIKAVFDAG